MSQAAHISQLQNLPLPAPVSYFPQTWGWLVLLLLVLGFVLWHGGRALWRWRRDRYRRAALAELQQLQTRFAATADRCVLRPLPDLLKRTALAMPGAPDVASLHAQAWQDFLQRCSPSALPGGLHQLLATLAYAPDEQLQALPDTQIRTLLALSQQWLEQHHVAV